ncbi:hypothetical protein NDU88_002846 [Pleurodeles waltl]|uniref:Myb/SANT-like DNA-binding domain-containing protein n=1 Tax=Pleurodeles waltl TaxID=8319 RepID=A0AAV7W0H5_PLEWA|nr:hypothetical protein NDU88_002846 [Pleurodeles waltl]
MARPSGERVPAFTAQELEKLVDGVLPQYTLLYGPPDQQVSAHQKKDIWRAIAKDLQTVGVHQRRSTHCRKRWEDIRRWSKKTAEAQLGMASQRGRGARRTMTPLMFQILAVAYPELVGRMRASQQVTRGIIRRRYRGTGARGGCVPQGHGGPHHGLRIHQWDGGRGELHGGQRIRKQRDGLVLRWELPCGGGTICAPHFYRSRSSTSAKKIPVPVVPVRGMWSALGTRAASVTRSQSTASPPPVKHQKLDSARRERGKTLAGKAGHKGPGGSVEPAVTPPKVVKGQKKSPKSGKSSTAEKAAILPAAQDATASPIVTGQETTAGVSAQEGPGSHRPAGQ